MPLRTLYRELLIFILWSTFLTLLYRDLGGASVPRAILAAVIGALAIRASAHLIYVANCGLTNKTKDPL